MTKEIEAVSSVSKLERFAIGLSNNRWPQRLASVPSAPVAITYVAMPRRSVAISLFMFSSEMPSL